MKQSLTFFPFALSALASSLAVAAETPATLNEVLVTATQTPAPSQLIHQESTVLTAEDLQQYRGLSVPEILAKQSGILVNSTGGAGQPAGIFMRGANTNQTLILIDGVRVHSGITGASPLHLLPAQHIERIEIVRGANSGVWGADAIGGVIQIFTKNASKTPYLEMSAGLGTEDTQMYRLSAQGVYGENTRYSLSASFYQTDGESATTKDNAWAHHPDDDGSRQQAVSAMIAHDLGNGHEIGAQMFQQTANTQYDAAVGNQFDDRAKTRQNSYAAWGKAQILPNWQSTLRYAEHRDAYDSFANNSDWATGGFKLSSSQLRSKDRQWQWLNQIDISGGQIQAGVEYLKQNVGGNAKFSKDERDTKSAFIGYLAEYGDVTVQTALRYDDNSQFGDKTTGNIALGYRITPHIRALASYGTAFRAPTFADLYQDLPGYRGNPDLKPENAKNQEIALEYSNANTQARLTYFHQRVQDLIAYQYDAATFMGTMANISRAKMEGVSLSAQHTWGDLELAAHYNWLEAKNRDTGHWLAFRAQHFGNVSAAYRFNERLRAGVDVQAVGHRYASNNNSQANRLGGYALANVFADFQMSKHLSATARIENILNRDYVQNPGYRTPGVRVFTSLNYSM